MSQHMSKYRGACEPCSRYTSKYMSQRMSNDRKGCKRWEGHDCTDIANGDDPFYDDYDEEDQAKILANCILSCGICTLPPTQAPSYSYGPYSYGLYSYSLWDLPTTADLGIVI